MSRKYLDTQGIGVQHSLRQWNSSGWPSRFNVTRARGFSPWEL